jgi:hypothetical protein
MNVRALHPASDNAIIGEQFHINRDMQANLRNIHQDEFGINSIIYLSASNCSSGYPSIVETLLGEIFNAIWR